MPEYKVRHDMLGVGTVKSIENGIVTIEFKDSLRKFRLVGLDNYFYIFDDELKRLVNKVNDELKTIHANRDNKDQLFEIKNSPSSFSAIHHSSSGSSSYALIGNRSQSIGELTAKEMYEIVGFLANPKNVSSFEAEVPADGRDKIFEKMFPGQPYRPISISDTPSGLQNKLSAQFRINLSSLRNCPTILRKNIGVGNGSCVGRINKSKFVLDLVEKYGFRFGRVQNVEKIKGIASRNGYLASFEHGYNL